MIKRINGFVIAFRHNTLNFHKYFKDKLSSQPSDMHNTRHRPIRNFYNPIFNHSKTQKCYLYRVIPIWGLQTSLKNFTSKFAFKKQIKSHLLASQSKQYFNYQSQHQLYFTILFPKKILLLISL